METIGYSEKLVLDWVPMERVGPFIFGHPINILCQKYLLKLVPKEFNEKVGWEVYRSGDDFSVFSEGGRIDAVSCSTNCYYKGTNIIRIPYKKFSHLFEVKPDMIETVELSDGPQNVYDFDDLGLQIWEKNGIVATAICSGPCEGEET